MSHWTRVPPGASIYCGRCGVLQPPGAAVLALVIAHGWARVARTLSRCEACEGAAPPDLPALPERVTPARVVWTPVARVAADWRARAAGREPGEEG